MANNGRSSSSRPTHFFHHLRWLLQRNRPKRVPSQCSVHPACLRSTAQPLAERPPTVPLTLLLKEEFDEIVGPCASIWNSGSCILRLQRHLNSEYGPAGSYAGVCRCLAVYSRR